MSPARRTKVGCGAVALLPLGLAMALWTAPVPLVDLVARLHRGCLYRVPTQAPVVALTVDDGPDSVSTPLILNALRREQARATFFLITQRLDGREPIVRAMVAAGHEVGNHFTSDRASIRLTANEFEADLVRAHKALRRYGPVTWARPGSGWHSGAMIETMQRHGYRCSLGSVYPLDAAIPSASFAARYVLRNVRPGAIVVLHDGGARGLRTARALGEILPELRRRGYRVVTLSKLVSERLEWPPGLPPPQAAVE